MELIISGGWLGREGLLRARVKEVKFYSSIDQLNEKLRGFLVVSYDCTEETLGVPIKTSDLPRIIYMEVGHLENLREVKGSYELKFRSFSLPEEEFKGRVLKVKDYIESGDVYQINLTSRADFYLEGDLRSMFVEFYRRQPVPYAFLADLEDFFIVSGSMELFLEKNGNTIVSKPIKGTGGSPEEILSSEKERAENLMITDMMRNDLGRIAEVGTVRVRELFKVERFKTLCQMHSTVEARTRADLRRVLMATFPPASVTGAPKRRAVEIIEELEPHFRGYYCGCAGLVWEENFTLSVLIRTAYGRGNEISYFAGCGIVWDSDPDREFREMLMKIRAFYNFSDEEGDISDKARSE